ncbi:MAG: VOC family protein [Nitrososphaerales archaeon]
MAFTVPDLKKEIERLRQDGVEIAKEPYSISGSKSIIAFIKDPNGIWLELSQRP